MNEHEETRPWTTRELDEERAKAEALVRVRLPCTLIFAEETMTRVAALVMATLDAKVTL